MYLYLLTNTVNGKGYVGITTQPMPTRFRDHLSKARNGGKTVIAQALRKYGKEAFTVTLLAEATAWEELTAMEQDAIMHYNTLVPHGYNMTRGGDGILGFTHSEETKQRIAEKKRGIPAPEHVRIAVGNRHRGVPKSPEQRQKIGDAQRGEKSPTYGKPMPEEIKQRISATQAGRQYNLGKTYNISPETRAYLSSLRRGRTHTAEARAKIAAGHRGKPRDEATKAKLSAATKAYLAEHGNPMQGRTQSEETRAKIAAKALARARAIRYQGVEYPSIAEAARATGLSRNQLVYRLETGDAEYLKKDS